MRKKYKIKYTYSSRDDIRGMKKYILDNFKYRELGENFTKKIKTAVDGYISLCQLISLLWRFMKIRI